VYDAVPSVLAFKIPDNKKSMLAISSVNKPIHNYERRLERSKINIAPLPNGGLCLQFLDHISALGLSVGRVSKYAAHIPTLLRMIDKDVTFKNMSKVDVEGVVAKINSRAIRASTKSDVKLLLRKLVQYAKTGSCAKGEPLPPEVSWVSLIIKEKNPRVTPESLLTPEELVAILNAALTRRDRAMIYVLFEAALRPSELLTMRVGSVVFKDEYCLITANGKTGIKRIPLVTSSKPLLDWLEEHPLRNDPEAPLWSSLSRNHLGERLSYPRFRVTIKAIAQRAKIKKNIWPYLYRHTSLTSMAKVFTECRLEQFAGWTYGSKMTRRYVHFSARDLEDAILELHGLKVSSKETGLTKLVECPRCSNKNPFGNVRCSKCGLIIDTQTALKLEDAERLKEEKLQQKNIDLQARLDKLESVITAILRPQNKQVLPVAPPLLSSSQQQQ
jgi:integrase